MKFITVKEAAKVLGVAENTIRSWADAGHLKSKRHPVNGYRLFKRLDCERLLKKIVSNF